MLPADKDLLVKNRTPKGKELPKGGNLLVKTRGTEKVPSSAEVSGDRDTDQGPGKAMKAAGATAAQGVCSMNVCVYADGKYQVHVD